MMKSMEWLKNLKKDLLEQNKAVLTLQLTALFLLMYEFTSTGTRLSNTITRTVFVLMLLNKPFLLRKEGWLIVSGTLTLFLMQAWSLLDNNHYLILYWLFACTIACSFKNTEKILAWNGRMLVGLAFAFAVGWKFFNLEYFDGFFFHHILLADSRFNLVTFLGGLSSEQIAQNTKFIRELWLFTGPNAFGKLHFHPSIGLIAIVLCYWTLFIESAIVLCFLCTKSKLLSSIRNIPLLIFIVTTYPIAPVPRFAMVLIIMGFAQCNPEEKKAKLAYLLAFILTNFLFLLPKVSTYIISLGQ